MAITTKELSTQLEEVTARLRAIESGQHVMTSSPGLPLDKWNDHGFVHRHEIKPLVRAINNGGGSAGGLEERVEQLESGQNVLTSVTNQQAYEIEVLESGQAVLTSAMRNKQDKLIAGSGIDITENVISATGGSTIDLMGEVFIKYLEKFNAATNNSTIEKIGEDDNYKYYCACAKFGAAELSTGTNREYSHTFNMPAGDSLPNSGVGIVDSRAFMFYNTHPQRAIPIPGAVDDDGLLVINRITIDLSAGTLLYYRIYYTNTNATSKEVTSQKYGFLFSVAK